MSIDRQDNLSGARLSHDTLNVHHDFPVLQQKKSWTAAGLFR